GSCERFADAGHLQDRIDAEIRVGGGDQYCLVPCVSNRIDHSCSRLRALSSFEPYRSYVRRTSAFNEVALERQLAFIGRQESLYRLVAHRPDVHVYVPGSCKIAG